MSSTSDSAISTLSALANDVELALESVFVHSVGTSDKNLLDVWLRNPRHAANGIAIHRRISPSQNGQPFFTNNLLENSFALQALMFLDRQERHADGIFTDIGKIEAKRQALADKEFVWNLNQNTGAVTGFRIAAAGTAVGQVDQYLNALEDDVVALLTANAGDKADPASVMLVSRVVQPLGRG